MPNQKQTSGKDDFNPSEAVPRKPPEEWKTGDEKMTAAQASYLKTLSTEAGEAFHDDLSKAEAARRIEELQEKTGRGRTH